MLVLHGFWSMSGSLRLWAEDSDLLVKSPSQALRSARPHPFAAAADAIAGIHPGKPGTSVLLLPSLRSAPLDSPELIRVVPAPGRANRRRRCWRGRFRSCNWMPGPRWRRSTSPSRTSGTARPSAISPNWPLSRVSWSSVGGSCRSSARHARARSRSGVRCCRVADVVAMTSLTSAMPPVCRAELGGQRRRTSWWCRRWTRWSMRRCARRCRRDRPAAAAAWPSPEASARRGGLADGADRSGRPVRRGTR